MVIPVIIGTGKRLFRYGSAPATLRLVDSRVSTRGVVMVRYEPAGDLVTGSFAEGEPPEA